MLKTKAYLKKEIYNVCLRLCIKLSIWKKPQSFLFYSVDIDTVGSVLSHVFLSPAADRDVNMYLFGTTSG